MKNRTTKGSGHGNGEEHVPSKYDANIRKNGFLHFQIGLILSLLLVFGVFQISFPIIEENFEATIEAPAGIEEYAMKEFKVVTNEHKKKRTNELPDPVAKPVFEDFVIADPESDDVEDISKYVGNDDPKNSPSPITLYGTGETSDDVEPDFYDIAVVQNVPVFPGCDKLKTNKEKTECLSAKIMEFIQHNFDSSLAGEYGLSGKQRIYVQFQIDKEGKVTNVTSRAPHKMLEKEAERVINKLPKMTPGKVQNKNVTVRYMVPIVFEVK